MSQGDSGGSYVCGRCHTRGTGRIRGFPVRSVGLLVLLLPTAWMLTAQSEHLGRAIVLVQPLWFTVFVIPVAWFLIPSQLRCHTCDSGEMVPVRSPRGKAILESNDRNRTAV